MERIAKLIFAATALWLFYLGLGFSMTVLAGNGGEYWGYDGTIEPHRAAMRSFEAGDKRFLAYELTTSFSGVKSGSPQAYRCNFHLNTERGHLRFNEIEAKHGYDSVRKAEFFAFRYNDMLAVLLSQEEKYWCEKVDTK